jgi:hypothetical protein
LQEDNLREDAGRGKVSERAGSRRAASTRHEYAIRCYEPGMGGVYDGKVRCGF